MQTQEAKTWLWGGVAGALILVGALWLLNRGYGQLDERGYDLTVALLSICNRQDAERLEQLDELIQTSQQNAELGRPQAKWLANIVRRARAGNWVGAAADARRLLQHQATKAEELPPIK